MGVEKSVGSARVTSRVDRTSGWANYFFGRTFGNITACASMRLPLHVLTSNPGRTSANS